ncbi:hypothetical protein TNCV_4991341 [Trichonephila clavipes]|nr:hypothetical protein TNCV_4991341 [Trichonephila clavipes]
MARQSIRAKAYCANSVYTTLGPEAYEQMFRSRDQSDAKPPVLSSQTGLILIYRSTEGMKGRANLAQSGKAETQDDSTEYDRGYRSCFWCTGQWGLKVSLLG